MRPAARPTVSISASPSSIERGQSATLRWSSTHAVSAEITPGIGTVPTSGSRSVSPTTTTTYRITVRGGDGQTASASATVTVTEPPSSLAPADQDAFNDVFVGKRVLSDDPNYFIDFVSPGRFKETEGSDIYPGSYGYRNTGSNTGTVTLNYDDGDRCTFQLTFASATSGTATFSCNDGTSGNTSWRLVDIPSDDDDEDTSQTCVKGSVIKPGGSCDLKDADGMKIGTFSVSDSGRGCLRIGGLALCQGSNRFNLDGAPLNQYVVTFIASKGSDGSWTISKISIS